MGHLWAPQWAPPGSRDDRPVREGGGAGGGALLLLATLQPQGAVQSLLPARDELITL